MFKSLICAVLMAQTPFPTVHTYAEGCALSQQLNQPLVTYVGHLPVQTAPGQFVVCSEPSIPGLPEGVYVSMWIAGQHKGYRVNTESGETIDQCAARLRVWTIVTCPGGNCPWTR